MSFQQMVPHTTPPLHTLETTTLLLSRRATVDEEDVLILCFRSTFGLDEWLMYPATLLPPTFLPHAGNRFFPAIEGGESEKKKGRKNTRGVYRVWEDTVNEVG